MSVGCNFSKKVIKNLSALLDRVFFSPILQLIEILSDPRFNQTHKRKKKKVREIFRSLHSYYYLYVYYE